MRVDVPFSTHVLTVFEVIRWSRDGFRFIVAVALVSAYYLNHYTFQTNSCQMLAK